MIEQRSMDRFPLALPTRIIFNDEGGNEREHECITSDICAGGVYIDLENPPSVDTNVKVDIYLAPDDSQFEPLYAYGKVMATGIVVHSGPKGMAISFKHNYSFVKVH